MPPRVFDGGGSAAGVDASATDAGETSAGGATDGGETSDGGADCPGCTVQLSPGLPQQGFVSLGNVHDTANSLTLKLGDVDGLTEENYGIVQSVAPGEAGAATWYEGVSHALFHGTRLDQVFTMGWNLKPSGTRVDPTDAAVGDQWESYYEQDSNQTWLERHWVFINSDGSYQRPLSCQMQRAGTAVAPGFTNCFVAADYFAIGPHMTNSIADFTFQSPPTGESFFGVANQADIRLFTNNKPQLLQQNVAGTALLTLAYVDAADMVHLGSQTQNGVTLDGATTMIAGNAVFDGLLSLTNGFAAYLGPSMKVPASPWIAMTLLNNWGNYDGGVSFPKASYFKDASGVVHLKGVVKGGTMLGATIAQLPAGYRPAQNLQIANVSNAAPAYVLIENDGSIIQQTGATASVALDGISFLAEQ